MRFTLREVDPHGKFIPQLRLELLAQVFPRETVQAVLSATGAVTQRQRKLNLEVMLWLLIGMNLFVQAPLESVLEKLMHGLRLLWPDDAARQKLLPGKSALSYRRRQLGVRSVRSLFHQCCQPLATAHTRGAFYQGLRLLAIDGHHQDLLDTPENAKVFGRSGGSRGGSAFPQVLCLCLGELGTHALIDATFWPSGTPEDQGAMRLLRSISAGKLVLWDAGLHSYALVQGVRRCGAHVLGRLPAHVRPTRLRRLPDGSFLAHLRATDPAARRRGEHLLVRIIEYTFTDPQAPGYGQRYRLVTTLLNHERCPAQELAHVYHERWELELVFDEQDTHQLEQHHPASPLRSHTPRGVIQELYGLLLAHYAVRALMHAAALTIDEDPDRLSFTHALQLIQESLPDFEIAAPELVPGLCQRLLRDLAARLLPEREPRSEPRVVRRKVIKWPLKRLEHYHWPKRSRPLGKALELRDWGGAFSALI